MRNRIIAPALLSLLLPLVPAAAADCPLFVLEDGPDGLTLERQDLQPGRVSVFPVTPGSGTITVIVPYAGPGVSGDLVQRSGNRLLIAQCVDGELRTRVKAPGGSERDLPPVPIEEFGRYDIRVNVTSHDGDRRAFLIREGKTIVAGDPGPVLDLFAGRVPLGEGDYSVTTEITPVPDPVRLTGEAPLEFAGGYFFVRGRMPGSRDGLFAVDTGGGHSVVAKDFLPDGQPIREAEMIEYSDAGRRSLKYAPGGAGGPVETIVGVTRIEDFRIGTIRFPVAPMDVISELPELGGRRVDGIVGLDLLRRGGVIDFEMTAEAPDAARLVFGGGGVDEPDPVDELPFALVKTHIFLQGRIAGQPVHFILDTGAPDPFLSASTAGRLGIAPGPGPADTGRGLDGAELDIRPARVDRLRLGDRDLADVDFRLSDLPVLQTIGGGQNSGLIGNAVLRRFAVMEIDFPRRVVRFAGDSAGPPASP